MPADVQVPKLCDRPPCGQALFGIDGAPPAVDICCMETPTEGPSAADEPMPMHNDVTSTVTKQSHASAPSARRPYVTFAAIQRES